MAGGRVGLNSSVARFDLPGGQRAPQPPLRRFLVAVAAAVVVVAPVGCGREPVPAPSPRPAPTLAYDVAARAWVAAARGPRMTWHFGTPGGDPLQGGGFVRARLLAGQPPFAWARRRAEITLHDAPDELRALVLDLEPAPGLARQAVRVFLRGAPVGRLELTPGRRAYRLALPLSPAGSQARLQLLFDAAADAPDAAPGAPRVAARLFALTLARPDDPALELLAPARGAPTPALGVSDERGAARVTHVAPGALEFHLALPRGARLGFAPWVGRGAGAGAETATLRVVLTPENGAPATLWSAPVAAGTRGREVGLALPGNAGDVVRLSFEAETAAGVALPVGWEGARVTGEGADAGGLLAPRPPAPGDAARADALRARLRDANVVLVVLDAARARSFSCYGSPRRTTPESCRLASEGVLFERAFTPAVFTLSAMASLWTSLPPLLHHAGAAYDDALPPGPTTLAEILSARGVHAAGFIANSMAGPAFGLHRGFAEFDEVHLRLGNRGEAVTRVVSDWLRARRAAAGRFFLYVHLREPHFPYDPPAPFDTLFGPDAPLGQRERRDPSWYGAVNDGEVTPTRAQLEHLERLYDGNLAYADARVGDLRRALAETGQLERSVVIVTADHGEALYEHGWIGHNQQVFEPSTRIPLIVRFPGGAPSGVRAGGLVDLLDVAPTVADVFGLRDEARARGFRGRSLLDAALGAPGKAATYAVSTGELRAFGLRHARFKYVRNVHFGVERLFDLEADPGESRDLAPRLEVRAAWYREELHAHVLELLGAARGPGARARLTPEQLENLKSLGYLN